MSHYCGIDLHSNNHVVVVTDEEDKRVLEKRLNNDLSLTFDALLPFRESLQGIAVESTFNWYWLVDGLEQTAHQAVKLTGAFQLLQTVTGIGKILGLTIMLETGTIERFAGPGNFASYCRCVDSKRMSNGKKKGEGNAKAGNKYLSWAFSEAAHFAVRFEPLAQRFYERKKARTNGIIAIRAVARKLARATWMMLKLEAPYDAKLMFPG
jgi:transposase